MEYLLTKNFKAGAAVAARRICRLTETDEEALQASTSRHFPIGISADLGAATGGALDIHLAGIAILEAGAAIPAGARVAAGADGKGVAAPRQSVFQQVVDGAAANADIAVTGLSVGDTLVSAIELASGYRDRTSASSIHAQGVLRVSAATNGDKLLVSWQTPIGSVGVALESATADGDLIRVLIQPQEI